MSVQNQVFNDSERRSLLAIAEALIPSGGPFPLGARDVDFLPSLEEELAQLEPTFRDQVRWLLKVWEWGNLLWPPFKRFSSLDLRERIGRLSASYHSRHLLPRTIAEALKQLCGFAFMATPQMTQAMSAATQCISGTPAATGPRLHPKRFPELRGDVIVSCDVCVVGSGAGGAVVAAECARAGLRVVVVEEGDYYTQHDFQASPFRRMLQMYRDHGATASLGRPPIPIPLGKAVGGTTVINSGTCFRTPEPILRLWEQQYGLEGFDEKSMSPYFDRVEHILHVQPVPWEIIGNNALVFDRGVRVLGLHGEPLRRNIKGCRGCGVCVFGCPSDAKQAMHLSYLPIAERGGATIYARCRVDRLIVAGKRVRGVEARILGPRTDSQPHGRLRVFAESVVLACGALHTPTLLRRAGLGLRSGQLGKNLALHPAIGVTATFKEPLHHWNGTLQSYFVDHLHLSDGVMIEVTTVHPAMALSAAKAVGWELKEFLADLPNRASAGLFASDSRCGEISFLPGLRRPLVRYDLSRFDVVRLLRGMALVGEIFFAAGAVAVHTNLPGLERVDNPRDLRVLRESPRWDAKDLHVAAFHPVGTCRMGPQGNSSVVDLKGRVHDAEGLYVADASLFPTCPGVNPQETIMALATKIAEGISGRLAN
ncbi:MAG: GMC family oxidoreductase [Candidatus Binatia bacterium]|nr:GMC family oxidoreductase [Candidatus Binatia bacterium]